MVLDEQLFWWIALGSGVFFLLSLLSIPLLVVAIPRDYFVGEPKPIWPWLESHPVLRSLIKVFRNLLAVVLVLAGLAMLALPGQGILTLLFAAVVSDFPGKRRIEIYLIQKPKISKAINWLRYKMGKEELKVPHG